MLQNANECCGRQQVMATEGQGSNPTMVQAQSNAMPTQSADLCEALHGINNVLVSILLNAQIMEWQLPSYSRMRRNTHEIQRAAQRGGVLLKRLAAQTEGAEAMAEAIESL